ncbi:hypothetical protein DQ244_16275 [Blastococcus sp. TBT05-19]|uniref:hypothetical protein n=1 Tax=Blastococcus sp. TBT05-19 TaxID=2250581 RepID=UPI000DE84CFA|nr:hypothetical protein [Blastococcus sp. TBT05-19]RBY88108.1 hypothetical protein DQ244_16275 [Blastococcus sp. TBT05-19]
MDDDIQLISDGNGLAVIGSPGAVERFVTSAGLPSKDLGLRRLGSAFQKGSAFAQAGSEIATHAGRWVKLTEESAKAMANSPLMKGSQDNLSRAIAMKDGKTKHILEIVKSPGSKLSNPAVLTGAAGLMAQLAMQQAMDEITNYLAAIDKKVDDVLRAQTDAVLADMIGAGMVIDEAMVVREQVGRVSEVTWSKVQAAPMTIASTQGYALRQLDALAEKLERKDVGDLAEAAAEAQSKTQEWLAVLARCFSLQDALGVLELDRVLDASPEELDQHRLALQVARENRVEAISQTTEGLLTRIAAAADLANAKVLLNPRKSRVVVQSGNEVASNVVEFSLRLGLESGRELVEARRWADAAAEARDSVLATGAEGVDAVKHLGSETLDAAKSFGAETVGRARWATSKLSRGLAERAGRRRGHDEVHGKD